MTDAELETITEGQPIMYRDRYADGGPAWKPAVYAGLYRPENPAWNGHVIRFPGETAAWKATMSITAADLAVSVPA